MALSDALKAGPTVRPAGVVDAWLESLSIDDRNSLMQSAADAAWTTSELHRVARAHGLAASLPTFERWRREQVRG